MGIPNLLRFMKPFIEPVHIKKYAGKRVGIDAYSWLHKGAYSCSMELCINPKSDAAKRYLKYFMHHINLLRHYKVVPVVVFDGANIPCKSATEKERQKRREVNLALAKEKLEQGNITVATEYFRKAVHITPLMAHQLIQIIRSESIEFLVAPYEADAQLAYLSTLDADQGGIDAVVTEDSDLIAYGCPAIIFKMDRYGNGEEFIMERTFKTDRDGLSFRNFDHNLFSGMCVLAGCDFLPSIPGIGTKRAYSFVSKYKNLDRVLSTLKLDKRYCMPEDYADCFRKTLAVFHHARVYDVKSKSLKHLKPLEEQYLQYLNGDLDILGPELSPSTATAIAEGQLNPVTMEAFDQLSRTNRSIEYINISAFNLANRHDSQEISTRQSSITIFSSQESMEEITVVNEITLDQDQFKREALALGKLFAQPKCSQRVEKNEVERKDVPDNNPFKKRKLSTDQVEIRIRNESVMALDDEEPVVLCSPLSQESVESRPKERSVRKQKHLKMSSNKNDQKVNERSGILKFFMRL